ncbi:MAG: ATP-binding protein, partial [Shewanella sp.]
LIQVMQRIYPGRTIQSQYHRHLVLPFDRDDILELLGNLLDNACKHARKHIELHISQQHHPRQGFSISIRDDGEGVSDAALTLIIERGIRLDESIQGHGLGLSICKDIVDSYQGELSFSRAKLGGLAAQVFLPAPR